MKNKILLLCSALSLANIMSFNNCWSSSMPTDMEIDAFQHDQHTSIKVTPDACYFDRFTQLKRDIEHDNPLTIVLTNDNFTDPDSIHSFVDFIVHLDAMTKERTHPIHLIAVTDDEYVREDMEALLNLPSHPFMKDEIRSHIAACLSKASLNRGYRVADTAVVLGSLMDYLQNSFLNLTLVEGERTPKNTKGILYTNPYFGRFGIDYTDVEKQYLERIHPESGSKAVLGMLEEADQKGDYLYMINGGSLRLAHDIAQLAPSVASKIQAISAAGYVVGSEKEGEKPRTCGSWNQELNREAAFAFFSNPIMNHIGVDSFSNKASPTCDGTEMGLPRYDDYLISHHYDHFLTPQALENLKTVEKMHTIFASGFKPKMMDSMTFLYALGKVDLPMCTTNFRYDGTLHKFVQDLDADHIMSFPVLESGKHPLLEGSRFEMMTVQMKELFKESAQHLENKHSKSML